MCSVPTVRFLFLFVLLRNPWVLPVLSLNAEGAALLSFSSSIREDPEGALSTWSSGDPDPCSWNGITCRDGSVISLSLPNKHLVGFLPPALGSLPSLRHINLRSNSLFGVLPSGLFAARGLQSFVLYGNSLHGPLPPEIGNLSYLQTLDLSQNFLNGSIPSSVLQLKRLKTLVLSHNNLTSSLPAGIGSSLKSLEKLDLSYNQLGGSIPNDFGNLTSLQGTADLSHNLFSGTIPRNLGNLPEKVYIDLSYNNLSGAIPQNGGLENRGPTAFIGNPGLCGPPLKNPCPSDVPSSNPFVPTSYSPSGPEANAGGSGSGRSNGLRQVAVIAIVVSDVVCIVAIALAFFCCYWTVISSQEKGRDAELKKGRKCRKYCICFRKDESGSLSENAEQYDLVALDWQVRFDLDKLLKASAFVLGKSGIGIVYRVVLEDGLTLAARRLGEGGLQRFKGFKTEVEEIGKVRHPNIVALRAYYWSFDEKLLIYDYIPNGSLSAAIHGKAGTLAFTPPPWDIRLKIMKGVAKGLAFLHEFSPKKYVHGDLRPNNVLLGRNMEPYISDFGLSRLANMARGSPFPQSDASVSPLAWKGLCYQAPEALKTLKPSQKWDVYSFGVILLEMITGQSPMVLLETSEVDLVRWVQSSIGEKKPLSDVLDPFLADELEREDDMIAALKIALVCVQPNPEKRPSIRQIVDTLDMLIGSS